MEPLGAEWEGWSGSVGSGSLGRRWSARGALPHLLPPCPQTKPARRLHPVVAVGTPLREARAWGVPCVPETLGGPSPQHPGACGAAIVAGARLGLGRLWRFHVSSLSFSMAAVLVWRGVGVVKGGVLHQLGWTRSHKCWITSCLYLNCLYFVHHDLLHQF